MKIIKRASIFLGVILFSAIVINLFFRAINFLFAGTFIIDKDTSAISLFIGILGGLFLALYYAGEEFD